MSRSARTGPDHAPEFTIAVKLNGFAELTATGPSKKLAEHKAAEAFLVREKVWKDGDRMNRRPDEHPLRLHRAGRRAQCRQVDAAELAGRHARCRSSRTRRRPRARRSAASSPKARRRSSSSIRPASSRPSAGSTAPWSGAAWTGAGDADIVALIVDVERGITPEVEALLDGLERSIASARAGPQQDRPDRA